MQKLIFVLLISAIINEPSYAQETIERIYDGGWASTFWRFKFEKDGTFNWSSRGHFGNRNKVGKYRILKDTLEITEGYENTAGTINKFYLIDGDSCIIDIRLRYAYCVLDKSQEWQYLDGREREIKYPQKQSTDLQLKKDLDSVLNICFNTPEVTKYFKFEVYNKRTPTITTYYELNSESKFHFTLKNKTPIFKRKEGITSNFFIGILDINQNSDEININFKIHGEVVTFFALFNKIAGKWTLKGIPEYHI